MTDTEEADNTAKLTLRLHRPPRHSGCVCVECGRVFPCPAYIEAYRLTHPAGPDA